MSVDEMQPLWTQFPICFWVTATVYPCGQPRASCGCQYEPTAKPQLVPIGSAKQRRAIGNAFHQSDRTSRGVALPPQRPPDHEGHDPWLASGMRREADLLARLGEGPGCAMSRHPFASQRKPDSSPNLPWRTAKVFFSRIDFSASFWIKGWKDQLSVRVKLTSQTHAGHSVV